MKSKILLLVLSCCFFLLSISESCAKNLNTNKSFKNWKALGYRSEDEQRHLYQAGIIYWKYATEKIGEAAFIESLESCVRSNPFCAHILGGHYYDKKDCVSAYPLLSNHPLDSLKYKADPYGEEREFALGWMLANGCGVIQNYDKAIEHFKKCAYLGEKRCAWNVSSYYVEKAKLSSSKATRNNFIDNYVNAYVWLRISQGLKSQWPDKLLEESVSSLSVKMQRTLSELSLLTKADIVASKICSQIHNCTQ